MTDAAYDTDGTAPAKATRGLFSPSFLGLLVTQFLTATNDNIFRWLVIGIGKQYVPPAQHGYILMAGTACFVIPYLILAAPAGYLADRFSKRTVIVWCKFAEIVIMSLGVVAIVVGSFEMLIVVVGLMGAQSALFSPSKLGSIPEMLPSEKISAANGLVGLTTVCATLLGMAVGNYLTDVTGIKGQPGWWLSALVLVGVAAAGWLISLPIARLPIANAKLKVPWNPFPKTYRDLRILAANRPMVRVAMGVAFFWSLGALAQLNIDQFAFEGGATKQTDVILLLWALGGGVGVGSILAAILSGGRVELGLVPLGALLITFSAGLLFLTPDVLIQADTARTSGYFWAAGFLFFLGTGAGLFNVPLAAYMQHRSPRQSRGAILAASNFFTFFGILVFAVMFYGFRKTWGTGPLFTSRQIFLICGIFTLPVFLYALCALPQATVRMFVWIASHTLYRIRVRGHDNLPEVGGALLVSNHISWLDGFLLLLASSRPVRLIAWGGNLQNPWLLKIAKFWGTILISGGPKSIMAALKEAREALNNGELVAIFPEGGITRTGQIQGFKPGLMKILKGTDVPVVPVYLDELWGSIFSFQGGKFFWKWPRRWPYPITIHLGQPVENPQDLHQVRRAVQDLGASAVEQRMQRTTPLPRAMIRRCKQRKFQHKVADTTGAELSGGALLARTLVLRRLLLRHVLAADEQYVGVLLPPSLGGVATNMALALDRRVAVNLNYTVSSDVMNSCIRRAGIKHILTSRKFFDKINEREPLDLDAELIFLEDFKEKPTLSDKLVAAWQTYLMPARMLERWLGLHRITGDDVLTVIFTSGSTGEPKGVMLTHANIASNVEAMDQIVHLTANDTLIGVLPFFHSFGYTVTLWAVMGIDVKGAYHFNPLDAKQIGKLCKKYSATILLATPTFLRSYLRRCEKEDLATLDVVVAGAEKLPSDLCVAFEEKFGVRPVEGYGATELSPLVSVNVPPSRSQGNFQVDCKEGTVGRPVPGVSAKVVDLDTSAELSNNEAGMLMITGPNVMKGYLGREDLTAEVLRDNWYVTGDVALIDQDGFIKITGRESRFSKIGGEMVPHILIEETLAKIIGGDEEDGLQAAVTAVPHAKKGERLIVIHTALAQTPESLRKALTEEGLPNLFIPSADSFHQVDELPILGTGKLDLKGIKTIALEVFGETSS